MEVFLIIYSNVRDNIMEYRYFMNARGEELPCICLTTA